MEIMQLPKKASAFEQPDTHKNPLTTSIVGLSQYPGGN